MRTDCIGRKLRHTPQERMSASPDAPRTCHSFTRPGLEKKLAASGSDPCKRKPIVYDNKVTLPRLLISDGISRLGNTATKGGSLHKHLEHSQPIEKGTSGRQWAPAECQQKAAGGRTQWSPKARGEALPERGLGRRVQRRPGSPRAK